jgi:hypothetical protein
MILPFRMDINYGSYHLPILKQKGNFWSIGARDDETRRIVLPGDQPKFLHKVNYCGRHGGLGCWGWKT